LSKGLTETVAQLFRPQKPLWACEFTSRHIVVAGVDGGRRRVQAKSLTDLPYGLITASLGEKNIKDAEQVRSIVRQALRAASFKGSEIVVVIPDESARIAFLTAETLPKTVTDQQTFLRWKLKKTVPFDVDSAQITFQVVGTHANGGRKSQSYDLLVTLSPRSIIEEYENLMDGLDIHAGFVVPSTLAALNLLPVTADDTLFVKVAPDCVTTTVFQNKQIRFYRRVADLGLYESVYPTLLYYQDKLGGSTLKQMVVCSDGISHLAINDLQERIGLTAVQFEPRNIDDVYKPALGAVHLSWANLI